MILVFKLVHPAVKIVSSERIQKTKKDLRKHTSTEQVNGCNIEKSVTKDQALGQSGLPRTKVKRAVPQIHL